MHAGDNEKASEIVHNMIYDKTVMKDKKHGHFFNKTQEPILHKEIPEEIKF